MELTRGLEITLFGMIIVFVVLIALYVLLSLPARLARPKVTRKEVPAEQPSMQTAIPAQHIAAIGAAIAALDQEYRVKIIEVAVNENWQRCRYTDIIAP